MQERQSSRDVSARAAVEAIRGTMSNNEVMERFKISPRGFADLLKQLFEKKLISEDDMARRGIRFKIKKAQDEPEPEPAPKPRITPAPAPRVMSAPRNATQGDSDEEFLDTIALTKLFTTFGPSPQAKQEQPQEKTNEPEPAEESKEETEESTDKKGKFSITGFFKKVR